MTERQDLYGATILYFSPWLAFGAALLLAGLTEEILFQVEGTSPHCQIILDGEGGADTLQVKVEVSEKTPSLDELKTLETVRVRLVRRIKADLDVEAKVTFVEPRSLRQVAGGQGRVVDNRK